MSVTRIAIISVSVGVVSLVLAGIHAWLPSAGEGASPAEVVAGSTTRHPESDRTTSTRRGSDQRVGPRPASTMPSPADTAPRPAESHEAGATLQSRTTNNLLETFATARQDSDPQRRIEALQFLGEHALQEDLEALQRIQLQDPSPEVRHAAEKAVHLLLARFSGQPWPNIPSGAHPFDYMGGATSPGAP